MSTGASDSAVSSSGATATIQHHIWLSRYGRLIPGMGDPTPRVMKPRKTAMKYAAKVEERMMLDV